MKQPPTFSVADYCVISEALAQAIESDYDKICKKPRSDSDRIVIAEAHKRLESCERIRNKIENYIDA